MPIHFEYVSLKEFQNQLCAFSLFEAAYRDPFLPPLSTHTTLILPFLINRRDRGKKLRCLDDDFIRFYFRFTHRVVGLEGINTSLVLLCVRTVDEV